MLIKLWFISWRYDMENFGFDLTSLEYSNLKFVC